MIGSSPTGASSFSSQIPLLYESSVFSSSPSSYRAQSIPLDSTPRMVLTLISKLLGNIAPGSATITLRPTLTLGAPHTICFVSFPKSTIHM